jgi:hypothetical protein
MRLIGLRPACPLLEAALPLTMLAEGGGGKGVKNPPVESFPLSCSQYRPLMSPRTIANYKWSNKDKEKTPMIENVSFFLGRKFFFFWGGGGERQKKKIFLWG